MFDYLDILTWILIGIGCWYLGMPLLIRAQQRMQAHPDLKVLDFYQLESGMAKFLMERTEAMFALGFEEPTLVHLPTPVTHVTTNLIMLVNRKNGDKAMVTAIVGQAPGGPRLTTFYVEFSTRFETGEVFNTLNSSELLAFRPRPQEVRTQVPMVEDIAQLYRLHLFVMKKHGAVGKKELYERGQELDYLIQKALIKCYDVEAERGWLYFDPAEDVYRPTILGAYLMTWGLMQPFKGLRTLAMQKKAREILEEFKGTTDEFGNLG